MTITKHEREMLKVLWSAGHRVSVTRRTRKGHLRLWVPEAGRLYTIASSPSDHRSGKNALADIKRFIKEARGR